MNSPGRRTPLSSLALIAWLALQGAGCGPSANIEEVGGYRVTYALRAAPLDDPASSVAARQEMAVAALQRRLDAIDLPGAKAAKSGTDQIQLTLPGISPATLAQVQKLLAAPGKLEFRILAQKGTHHAIIEAAIDALNAPGNPPPDDPPQSEQASAGEAAASRWVVFDPSGLELSPDNVQRTVGGRAEVLIVLDDINVEGSLLESVNSTVDSVGQPAVAGRFGPEGTRRMSTLTTENAPRGNVYQRLGVVLDDRLLVAPNIQEPIVAGAFRLTGKFTKQEIEFLVAVLRAGQLPVELEPQPAKIEQVTGTRQ